MLVGQSGGKLTVVAPGRRPSSEEMNAAIDAALDSVAVELDQPLVADPEVVRDLVQHDAADLPLQQLGVVAVEPLERPAVDRDLVRRRTGVLARAGGERDPFVEPEQRLPAGGSSSTTIATFDIASRRSSGSVSSAASTESSNSTPRA